MFLHQRIPSGGLKAWLVVALLGLAACDGGSSGSGSGTGNLSTHTIGGTVTGLKNERLALKNNDSEPLEVIGTSFSFPKSLNDGSTYNVTVASNPDQQLCSVGNASGKLAGADVTDVEVLCRYWRSAGLVETSSEGTNSPQITFGPSGQGIAVWRQYDGSVTNLYASHFSGGSWGIPEVLETNSEIAANQQVAIDPAGNAIAVWEQNNDIYANRFSAADGSWGGAVSIKTDSGYAGSPQIALDPSGNAIAVWRQDNSIYANRFSAVTGIWGDAGPIETGADPASGPQIAVDPSGNAVAAWTQNNDIYANRFSGGTWGSPERLDTGSPVAFGARIAVDQSGNAIVVWRQGTYAKHIYAKRFSAADDSWGPDVTRLDARNPDANYPQIAFDPSGNATAVWQQAPNNGAPNSIFANRFSATDNSWGAAEQIETIGETASVPRIAIDQSGNVIAVWKQEQSYGAVYSIYANRFSAADGNWGSEAELIETGSEAADKPQIAFDASGNAFAVWQQSDGTAESIYANRFE